MDEIINNGIPMKCPSCGNEWVYRGKKPKYAHCSYCKTEISISKNRTDK